LTAISIDFQVTSNKIVILNQPQSNIHLNQYKIQSTEIHEHG